MKKTPLKKVGKQGRANAKANREIAEMFAMNCIEYCEADFPHDCDGMLTNAHRNKRSWYYTQPELLSDFNQVARLCVTAHQYLEHRREENEAFFIRIRG
jgi:hypothetical protein